MKSKKKILIIVIPIVVLVAAGVFVYNQFFTYKIDRIDANNVSKIVYIVDANVAPDKRMQKTITDPQDIKDFLDIYRDITFQKDISIEKSTGLNADVNVYDKSGSHELWFSSAAFFLSDGKGSYKSNLPFTNNNKYVTKAKAIASKYKQQPYK